jgi:hypothetical protein
VLLGCERRRLADDEGLTGDQLRPSMGDPRRGGLVRLHFRAVGRHRLALLVSAVTLFCGLIAAPRAFAGTLLLFAVGWWTTKRLGSGHPLSRRRIGHATLITAGLWSMAAVTAILTGFSIGPWAGDYYAALPVPSESRAPEEAGQPEDVDGEQGVITAYLTGVVLTGGMGLGLYGLRGGLRRRRHGAAASTTAGGAQPHA